MNTTNHVSEIIQLTDQLAGKSPWTWLLLMFIGWLFTTGYTIRFISIKLNEINERLLKSESTKIDLLTAHKIELREIMEKHSIYQETMLTKLMELKAQSNQILMEEQRELTRLNERLDK